ncbi:hypothetical protein ACTFIZ_005724 [Dictyostelium cf. discoideum]
MDNINKYDNKCAIHKENKIKMICSTCKVVVCVECIILDHNGHKFGRIDVENSKAIFEEFKNNNFQNLHKQIDINNDLLNESNNLFKSLEDKHTENVNTITEEFKQLSKLLPIIENDKIKQLVTLYDENKDINTIISTTIHDNLNKINLITNKYKNTINQINIDQIINNNNNQHIEILKHCYQSQQLIKDNQNENKIKELINQYKNVNIVNNSEQIKDSIKEIFKISDSLSITNVKDPKRVTAGGKEYFIYKNDSIVPNGTTCVAIAPSVKTIKIGSIPTSVQYLILLDGFNVQLTEGMLPQSISHLLVGAIKKPLLKGSIPNNVYSLFLLDGFNQEISEIPQSVYELLLFDTPLTNFQYSNQIYRTPKYKHQLTRLNVINWDCEKFEIRDSPSITNPKDPKRVTDVENSKKIFKEFKNNNFQNLDKQIDINNELLNESNNLFKPLEDKHTENVNTILWLKFCEKLNCKEKVGKPLQCGNVETKECYCNSNFCNTKCKEILPCGDVCYVKCKDHKPNQFEILAHPLCSKKECTRELLCHRCNSEHVCKMSNACTHSVCNSDCSKLCNPCRENCKHGCIDVGLCGEKCVPICRKYNPDYLEPITGRKLSGFDENDCFIELHKCFPMPKLIWLLKLIW